MANVIPKEVKKEITDAWKAETWKACLLTNAFSGQYVSGTHILYSNISAYEVASGSGYTTGGVAMSATDKTSTVSGTNYVLGATDVQWTGATFAAVRFVVVWKDNGALDGPIRAIYEFNADKAVTSGTFTVEWHADGLIKVSS